MARLPRILAASAVLLGTLAAAFSFAIAGDGPGIREDCVARAPKLTRGGPAFELFDLPRREVWLTRDWTEAGFAAFKFPLAQTLWRKNDPRISQVDGGGFAASPGCMPGHYSYLTAYGRTFVHVVRFIEFGTVYDRESGLRGVRLEKHHRLRYAPGRTVRVLTGPDGTRYVGVSLPTRAIGDPALPRDWNLTTHRLERPLEIDLPREVTVLRTDTEESFQGPVPATVRL